MQIVIAIAIVVGFFILAWILRLVLVRYVKRVTKKSKTHLDDALLGVIKRPFLVIIIVLGFWVASLTFSQDIAAWDYTTKSLGILLSVLGIYTVLALINRLIKWYRKEVVAKNKNVGFSMRLISFFWLLAIIGALWLALIAALSIWGLEVGTVTDWISAHGWRIALIVIIAMGCIISMGEIVPRIVVHTITRQPGETKDELNKRSDTLSRVLISTSQIFIVFIGIFMILSELDIDIGPILAGAGVAGVAIGFGAQSLVKDIVAGLFVIIENQYRVGDVVKIADVSGVVVNINLRRTVLRDIDGVVHVVPNGEIRVASNYTKEWSRVNLDISVAYGEDLDRVIEVINKVCKEMAEDPLWTPAIINPPKVLRVNKLGDSGIDIKILGDTQPARQWEVTGELRLRLKRALDAEGIEIPWPHTKVYFGNMPEDSGRGQSPKGKK